MAKPCILQTKILAKTRSSHKSKYKFTFKLNEGEACDLQGMEGGKKNDNLLYTNVLFG